MDTKEQKKIKLLLKFERSNPSFIRSAKFQNGVKWTLEDGTCHRDYGPAIIYGNGSMEWWVNGKKHREDGPAVIYIIQGESFHYWIKGKHLTKEEFEKWKRKNKKTKISP